MKVPRQDEEISEGPKRVKLGNKTAIYQVILTRIVEKDHGVESGERLATGQRVNFDQWQRARVVALKVVKTT